MLVHFAIHSQYGLLIEHDIPEDLPISGTRKIHIANSLPLVPHCLPGYSCIASHSNIPSTTIPSHPTSQILMVEFLVQNGPKYVEIESGSPPSNCISLPLHNVFVSLLSKTLQHLCELSTLRKLMQLRKTQESIFISCP